MLHGRVAQIIYEANVKGFIGPVKEMASASASSAEQIKQHSAEVKNSLDGVHEASKRLRDSVFSLGGMIGFGELAFSLKNAAQSGVQLQQEQNQLKMALHGSNAEFEQMDKFSHRLATHGGFGGMANTLALTAFTRETKSATKAESDLQLATDIARGTNMQLSQTQTVVATAIGGRARALQRLLGPMVQQKAAEMNLTEAHQAQVIALQDQAQQMGRMGPMWLRQQELIDRITPKQLALAQLTDKQATAQQVIAAAQRVFGGATAHYATTTAGKLTDLQNALHHTEEALGLKMIPVITKVAGAMLTVVNFFAKLPGPLQAAALGLGAIILVAGPLHNAFVLMKDAAQVASTFTRLLAKREEEAAIFSGGGFRMPGPGMAAEPGVAAAESGGGAGAEVAAGGFMSKMLGKIPGFSKAGGLLGKLPGVAKLGEMAGKFGLGRVIDMAGPIGIGAMLAGTLINHIPFLSSIPGLGSVASVVGFSGGGVVPRYFADGGPMGTDTTPAWLTPGEGVLSLMGMRNLAALNMGGMSGGPTEITIRVPVRLDSRVLTEAVARYSLSRAARGPTSLIGGSLVTGAPGLPA